MTRGRTFATASEARRFSRALSIWRFGRDVPFVETCRRRDGSTVDVTVTAWSPGVQIPDGVWYVAIPHGEKRAEDDARPADGATVRVVVQDVILETATGED